MVVIVSRSMISVSKEFQGFEWAWWCRSMGQENFSNSHNGLPRYGNIISRKYRACQVNELIFRVSSYCFFLFGFPKFGQDLTHMAII